VAGRCLSHWSLGLELAPHQIRVNVVAPAVVATAIYEQFVPADKPEETLYSFDGFHPLGPVGTARDLASTITTFTSPGPPGGRSHMPEDPDAVSDRGAAVRGEGGGCPQGATPAKEET
jgi:NAD(P)-dependent dehydrogenase (short-subunit alcohol dehydrogenase family)